MAPQTSPARVIYPFNPHTKTANNLPKMGFFLHEDPDNTPLPIRSFVVDDHHPIVPRWRDVARQIMDKLDQAGLKWVAVECFQRRQLTQKSSTHDDTSVVITVQELTLETDHLQPLLHEIHVLSGYLFVEIVEGDLQLYASKHKVTIDVPYHFQPQIGDSIGPCQFLWSTGTFGGYLELFGKQGVPEKKICGLTCHHVLRPYDVTKFDLPPADHFEPFIAQAKDAKDLVPVSHPSIPDHENNLAKDFESLGMYHYLDMKLRCQMQEHHADATTLASINRDLAYVRSHISLFMRKIAHVKSADKEIGTFFASSGCGLSPTYRCVLDWGLIELKPERIGTNILKKTPTIDEGSLPQLTSSQEPLTINTVSSWSAADVQKGTKVFKIGRTSGLTEGVANRVESFISFRHTPRASVSMELAIVPEGNGTPMFCDYGDSGAFVITKTHGKLIGVVWGGIEISAACYVTPIKAVADHIREVTGYRVRLPGGEEIN